MVRSFFKFTDSELDTIFKDKTNVVSPPEKRALLEELLLILDDIYEAGYFYIIFRHVI